MAQARSARAATQRPSADHRRTEIGPTSIPRQPISPEQVDAALRALPSHGWEFGWTGRRDRALLVLSHMAGLSFQAVAELTIADIAIADAVAIISTPGGTTTLRSAPDGRICGPCALARWLHALDLTAIYPDPGVVTAVIARAAPLTANSPHLCECTIAICEQTRSMPVLPSIDQWGPVAADSAGTRLAGLSVGSISVINPVRPFARPVINRRPAASTPGSELAVTLTRTIADRTTLAQPGHPDSAKRRIQRDTPVLSRHLDLVRSNYSRADRELRLPGSAQLAAGLEGRARSLLEHRIE